MTKEKAEQESAGNMVAPLTRLVIVDIYDTLLFGDDPENAVPLRHGFIMWCERLKRAGVKIVAATDNDRALAILDLKKVFQPLNPHIFLQEVYELKMKPKDYSTILKLLKVEPAQVLVVGNDEFNDLSGAKKLGCRVWHVPAYDKLDDDFDFDSIPIL